MPPYKHQSSSRDIKDRAHALCGRKLDFKNASKYLAQHARKQSKSQSKPTGRSDSKVAKNRVHESAHTSRNRKQTNECRSRPAQLQSSTPAVGSKKRDREKTMSPGTVGQTNEANWRSTIRKKVTACPSVSGLSSKTATSDQKTSVTGSLKRKSEDGHDSPAKKAKVENKTHSPIITPAPAPTTSAVDTAAATDIAKNTSSEASPKRKAEDDIGAPIKKSKIEQPVENATSDSTSKAAGELMARKGHKRGNGGRSTNPPIAGNGKAGRRCNEERAAKSDTIKTATVKEAEAKGAKQGGSSIAEEQADLDIGKRPPRMANAVGDGDLMCFANTVIQALDSIPELRDWLIAKGSTSDGVAFPPFPMRTKREEVDTEAEEEWRTKIEQMLREQGKTFGQYLGQKLQHMREAAQKGETVCARGLMKMFSKRYDGYDGVSGQQEAFDFLDKVFKLLDEKAVASDDVSKQANSLVKNLFGGEKYTQLECTCGHNHDTHITSAYSLQLNVDSKSRATTISSCLNRAFATEKVEDYRCDTCEKMVTVFKKDRIKSWGKYLVLHLDRAQPAKGRIEAKMIKTKIEAQAQLNLDDLILDSQLPASKEGEGSTGSPPTVNYEPIVFIERSGVGCDRSSQLLQVDDSYRDHLETVLKSSEAEQKHQRTPRDTTVSPP
ncbi:MAG: hypothetical protein Q9199_001740 [Rusavskia elegans]